MVAPPFASIAPVKVDIPLTKSLAVVVTPETIKSPNTVAPIAVVENLSVSSKYKSTDPLSLNIA